MYNLSGKSIILAGLVLLLFLGCRTATQVQTEKEYTTYNIETLFPRGRESFVYMDIYNNKSLISDIATDLGFSSTEINVLNKSSDLYFATGYDLVNGFDMVLKGEYSKGLFEFGLFFSFSWKGAKEDGVKYWYHKDGLKLAIVDKNTVVISTGHIVPIITKLSGSYIIKTVKDDFNLFIPQVKKEFIQEVTSGFIKNGIELISISVNKNGDGYKVLGQLGVETQRKAKALSRLLGLFVKIALAGSEDPEVREISSDIALGFEENRVLVDNIHISEKKLIEILNKLIVNEGEADK